ncbi:MAG TPA: cell adhesion protein [Bacteroidetes bacterium]|jgi:uncharacterized surface protein with fasciclin (FAS1) repeats|nr:cell adhesion protein [Bacteroidota bacterium]
MKFLSFPVLMTMLLSVFFVGCDDDDMMDDNMNTETTSVVDLALATPELSILVEALQAANLVDVLADLNSTFTVLAPTNDAFVDILAELGLTKEELLAAPNLADILLFHVIDGDVRSTDLATGYVKTLNTAGPNGTSPSLRVVVDGGVTFNGGSTVTTADVVADNGVVHIINKVMLAPSIVDLALSNDAFTSLVAALTAPDNTTDFVGLLSGDGPFTVFAPTNDAFQALLDSEPSWNVLTDIPLAVREAVLAYHASTAGNVQAGDLTDGQSIPTLEGSNLTVDLSSGAQLITGSGQTVNIIVTDVQGTNGIVHVVDAVLIPVL